jgi:hypothetical protein
VRTKIVAALVIATASASCAQPGPSAPTSSPVRSPSHTASVTTLPDTPEGTAACGGYAIAWTSGPLDTTKQHPEITAADARGRRVLRATIDDQNGFSTIAPHSCGDMTGDGAAELVYVTYTGGAHCCSAVNIAELAHPDARILDSDLGNGGVTAIEQLDQGGSLEVVATSDVFAYFGDLSFAASPFLPLVFAFREGAYTEATRDFPDHVRDALRDAQAALGRAVSEKQPADALRGLALGVYGHDLLLGRTGTTLEELSDHVPAAVVDWLRAHQAEADELLNDRYGAGARPS